MNTQNFYSSLPRNNAPLQRLFLKEELFHRVPPDWCVIITDIENSSIAIAEGNHQTVNLIATGSIVAVLNIAHEEKIEIPFFFGGDGATVIVPPNLKDAVLDALSTHKLNVKNKFNLLLRVGVVIVSQLYEEGKRLQICRHKLSPVYDIPVILGDGLMHAENIIKSINYAEAGSEAEEGNLNMHGLQCRWDKVEPPEMHQEVISLLVMATSEELQAEAFSKVLFHIDHIYGDAKTRRSITVSKLRLVANMQRIKKELQARMTNWVFFHQITEWFKALLGMVFLKTGYGRNYLKNVVDLTDNIVLDGKINTVMSGTFAQKEELKKHLIKLETEGLIFFGFYASSATILSCYVLDLNEKHIHFVDGSEGGYTQASKYLKAKLKKMDVV